jgi:regulator of cell morphogenesis and NO signaling
MKSCNTLNQRSSLSGSLEPSSISGLISYIQTVHHGYAKKEIPLLADHLINAVVNSGGKYPELQRVSILFGALVKEIGLLIEKEELIQFPRIAAKQKQRMIDVHERGDLVVMKNHISIFEEESNRLKGIMAEIRRQTNNYTYPRKASPVHHLALASLEMLEINLYRHLYLDNKLFSKVSRS